MKSYNYQELLQTKKFEKLDSQNPILSNPNYFDLSLQKTNLQPYVPQEIDIIDFNRASREKRQSLKIQNLLNQQKSKYNSKRSKFPQEQSTHAQNQIFFPAKSSSRNSKINTTKTGIKKAGEPKEILTHHQQDRITNFDFFLKPQRSLKNRIENTTLHLLDEKELPKYFYNSSDYVDPENLPIAPQNVNSAKFDNSGTYDSELESPRSRKSLTGPVPSANEVTKPPNRLLTPIPTLPPSNIAIYNQTNESRESRNSDSDSGDVESPTDIDYAFETQDTDLNFLLNLIEEMGIALVVKPTVYVMYQDKYVTRPIPVNVRLLIETISDLSEVNMEMTVTFILNQFWNDPRLKRNSQSNMIVPIELIDKVWKPDIAIQGSKVTTLHSTTVNNQVMRVNPAGDIQESFTD